jgi:hypothetical protein
MSDLVTVLSGGNQTSKDATVAYVKRGLRAPSDFPSAKQLTTENIAFNLKNALGEKEITDYAIAGAQEKSIEHVLLMYYAFTYGTPTNWGNEYHARLPVEVHPTDSKLGERGQIILKLSATGQVTAQLVSRGPIKLPGTDDPTTVAPLLKRDFGVREVKNDGKQLWLSGDLQKVHQAFLRIPPPDREILSGITLIRVVAADNKEPNVDAFYRARQQLEGRGIAAKDDVFEFQIGNGTFEDDATSFVGRAADKVAPASFHTILHEVGHAVEKSTLRAKTDAHNQAGVLVKQLQTKHNNAQASEQPGLRKQYDDAFAEYERLGKARAIAKGANGSLRLDKFVAYVQTYRISPRITQYAATSWDAGKPGEFYAETYALWLNDPDFVRMHSEKLLAYFDSGAYRDDS